jgi:hypothetical protein
MSYKLTLTEADCKTISWVGTRYEWSWALYGFGAGEHEISEALAWELKEAFEQDTEGGHSMFPLLDQRSELCEKLSRFYNEIV